MRFEKRKHLILILGILVLLLAFSSSVLAGNMQLAYKGMLNDFYKYAICDNDREVAGLGYSISGSGGHNEHVILVTPTGSGPSLPGKYIHRKGVVQDSQTKEILTEAANTRMEAVKIAAEHWFITYYAN